jgi:hypothetical protein
MKMPLSLSFLSEKTTTLYHGGLAQLARALGWQSRGHRFESDILHHWEVIHRMTSFFIISPSERNYCFLRS